MKTLLVVWGTMMLLLFGCGNNSQPSQPNQDISTQINAFPKEPLSNDEMNSIIFMREEEKLARDVYTTLYDKWGTPIFNNIASSEQTHTTAVSYLLAKYGVADPAGNNTVGAFKDTTLQKLYNQLITQGNASVASAYVVGATIEDLDIHDLKAALVNIDNQDIRFVYDNLTKGSRNHLRSFYDQVVNSGGKYTPQFISQAEFDAIINSPHETGGW